MIHDNMNISRLMVLCKNVEEARAERKSRDTKRESSSDGGFSNNRLEIQDKPKFKKRLSNQFLYKIARDSGDRVSKPQFKKGKGTNSRNNLSKVW